MSGTHILVYFHPLTRSYQYTGQGVALPDQNHISVQLVILTILRGVLLQQKKTCESNEKTGMKILTARSNLFKVICLFVGYNIIGKLDFS